MRKLGNLFPVMIYMSEELLSKVEQNKGSKKRSAYVTEILEKAI